MGSEMCIRDRHEPRRQRQSPPVLVDRRHDLLFRLVALCFAALSGAVSAMNIALMWRALALKQFLQTSAIVFAAFFVSIPINALLLFLLAGVLGAALGAHYIRVEKPPYFD